MSNEKKSKETLQPEIPLQPIAEAQEVTEQKVEEVKAEVPVVAKINEIAELPPDLPSFSNSKSFEHAQRVAKMLAASDLIPQNYRGNIQNTMIALEMANRIGASPLQVMQNLYIVHGKPSWSSSFIIAAINASKKFSPLRFELTGEDDALTCFAWAYDLQNNEKLEGPKITMEMAAAEGWLQKAGSKWKTMPTLMIRYRAAAFFGRLYAPEILMGMQTMEEVIDAQVTQASPEDKKAALEQKLSQLNASING